MLLIDYLKNNEIKYFNIDNITNIVNDEDINLSIDELIINNEIRYIGSGYYTKLDISPLSGNLVLLESLPNIASNIIKELGYFQVPSKGRRDNLLGRSQVPTGRVIETLEKKPNLDLYHNNIKIHFYICTINEFNEFLDKLLKYNKESLNYYNKMKKEMNDYLDKVDWHKI